MRKLLSGLLAGFFVSIQFVTAGAANAAHISQLQYEFDVVDVDFHFVVSDPPALGSPDYTTFIDAVHPLADLRDQTFRMGVAVTDVSAQFPVILQDYQPTTEKLSTIDCTFGPVCAPGSTLFRSFLTQPTMGWATSDGTSFHTDHVFTSDYTISLRIDPKDGSGFFYLETDIEDFFTVVDIDGRYYFAQGPGITLTLANVKTPTVPLPVSALLLSAALIPLALLRRRRRN